MLPSPSLSSAMGIVVLLPPSREKYFNSMIEGSWRGHQSYDSVLSTFLLIDCSRSSPSTLVDLRIYELPSLRLLLPEKSSPL